MERFPTLKPLVKEHKSIKRFTNRHLKESVDTLAATLGKSRATGVLHLDFLEAGNKQQTYCLDVSAKACKVSRDTTGAADFKVVTSVETFGEMSKGTLSPIDAFLHGKLEVHGNPTVAKRLFASAASGRIRL